MARQSSQNEINARKKDEIIVVENVSKQQLAIQLMPPINPKTGKRVGFFLAEQTIMVPRGKMAKLPKGRLYMDQITNLQKQGLIKVKHIK